MDGALGRRLPSLVPSREEVHPNLALPACKNLGLLRTPGLLQGPNYSRQVRSADASPGLVWGRCTRRLHRTRPSRSSKREGAFQRQPRLVPYCIRTGPLPRLANTEWNNEGITAENIRLLSTDETTIRHDDPAIKWVPYRRTAVLVLYAYRYEEAGLERAPCQ